MKLRIFLNGEPHGASLRKTDAARDFTRLLPLDLTLTDFHGTEKVAPLPRKLDTTLAPASYAPSAGDITTYAPWGNLALFYRPCEASRGLVALGAFDTPPAVLSSTGPLKVRIERAD